jgi:hypothetical protein
MIVTCANMEINDDVLGDSHRRTLTGDVPLQGHPAFGVDGLSRHCRKSLTLEVTQATSGTKNGHRITYNNLFLLVIHQGFEPWTNGF